MNGSLYADAGGVMELGDLQEAGIKHLLWKKQVRAILDNRCPLEELRDISHKGCDFGKWLYSGVLDNAVMLKEAKELETIHIEAHMIFSRIAHFKTAENIAAAENEYKNLEEISKKIIGLLTALGRSSKERS